jgi:tetratricopeptide (TPR) repeat protein
MWALRVQGLVLAEQKRWRQAHQALERVAAYYRDHESPAGEAQTLETWGAIWLRQGHPDRAAERLREARALYHRLGAREAVERVEHASRALTAPR